MYEFGKKILIIYEFANNAGNNESTLMKMCDEFYSISQPYMDYFNFAIKFQYRNLDTFICKNYRNDYSFKYIKRFSETNLDKYWFETMRRVNNNRGMITICTPFDEPSVDLVVKHNFDIIKIASCSTTDWPLLNKISDTDKSLIISTAGTKFEDIDKVVAFFEHRQKQIVLMYCVASYPTEPKDMNLNQIDVFKERYPNISIGYSSHESPNELDVCKLALAKNCKLLEFHVAIDNFNSYSKSPEQVRELLDGLKNTVIKLGSGKRKFIDKELINLRDLKRGVWGKEDIKVGDRITRDNVYYAIPTLNNHLLANDMGKYAEIISKIDIKKDEAILKENITYSDKRERAYEILDKVKELLKKGNIHLPNKVDVHISHQYGIEKFYEYGAVIFDVINREYCKKVIVVLPGQAHPAHWHEKKEEAFHVLYGELDLTTKESAVCNYKVGDVVVVGRRKEHAFSSKTGCVFEEISTQHFVDDSYYQDEAIMGNKFRKTEMTLRDI